MKNYSLFNRMGETPGNPKFEEVNDQLFGQRNVVEMPPNPQPSAAPLFDNHNPQDIPDQPRYGGFSEQDINMGRQFLNQNGYMPQQYMKDYHIDISDEHLMSIAKLSVNEILLKGKLTTEPFKFLASYGFKFLGNTAKAEEIKRLDVNGKIEVFKELLIEIQFQELKDLQRANNLKLPSTKELIAAYRLEFFDKLAGDGFENAIDLFEGIFNKFKNGGKAN